jgi:hypothetical protein
MRSIYKFRRSNTSIYCILPACLKGNSPLSGTTGSEILKQYYIKNMVQWINQRTKNLPLEQVGSSRAYTGRYVRIAEDLQTLSWFCFTYCIQNQGYWIIILNKAFEITIPSKGVVKWRALCFLFERSWFKYWLGNPISGLRMCAVSLSIPRLILGEYLKSGHAR